jgi:hypothetical protein
MQTSPTNVDAIRRQMSRIRRKHRTPVGDVLSDARRVATLGRYLRPLAWAALGAAAATAICTVTKRRARVPSGAAALMGAAEGPHQAANGVAGDSERPKAQQGILDNAWNLVAPVIVRAAQDYALQCLEQWIAQGHGTTASPMPRGPSSILEGPNSGVPRTARGGNACNRPGSSAASGGSDNDRPQT